MYELTGTIKDLYIEPLTDKMILHLTINEREDSINCWQQLRNASKLSIKIDKYRKKRSLNANAYFWTLCGKLATKLRQDKISIYKELVKSIGDNFEVLPIKNEAVDTFIRNWQRNGAGWVCENMGDSKIQGYTNVCAYYGSSTYNSKQMSDLIDSVVFECKEQGIQVETPEQIARIKSLWEQE
jgi:hypothetical protein